MGRWNSPTAIGSQLLAQAAWGAMIAPAIAIANKLQNSRLRMNARSPNPS
jgi:hypothetical protein